MGKNREVSENSVNSQKAKIDVKATLKQFKNAKFTTAYIAKIAILTALSFILYAFAKFPLPFMFPGFLEIQIRTMAMNFWATVEHSLRYKYKEELPPNVAEKLKSTAHEVYKLDKEMQEIRDEIISAQTLFMHKSNVSSQILTEIGDLEKMGRYQEAAEFRQKFNEISAEKGLYMEEKLEDLSIRMKQAIKIEKESIMTEFERMEDSSSASK